MAKAIWVCVNERSELNSIALFGKDFMDQLNTNPGLDLVPEMGGAPVPGGHLPWAWVKFMLEIKLQAQSPECALHLEVQKSGS